MWLDEYPKYRDEAGSLDRVILPKNRIHFCMVSVPKRLKDGSIWYRKDSPVESLRKRMEANYDKIRHLPEGSNDEL